MTVSRSDLAFFKHLDREAVAWRGKPPEGKPDGVSQTHDGKWAVTVGGKMIGVADDNSSAWKMYDRKTNSPTSKAEDTAAWVAKQD